MEKKLYLATMITVIAIAVAILYSGSSYLMDVEESYDNSFTAGVCGKCTTTIEKAQFHHFDGTVVYNIECDPGCDCADEVPDNECEHCFNKTWIHEQLPGFSGGVPHVIAACLTDCTGEYFDHKTSGQTYILECWCDWGGD